MCPKVGASIVESIAPPSPCVTSGTTSLFFGRQIRILEWPEKIQLVMRQHNHTSPPAFLEQRSWYWHALECQSTGRAYCPLVVTDTGQVPLCLERALATGHWYRLSPFVVSRIPSCSSFEGMRVKQLRVYDWVIYLFFLFGLISRCNGPWVIFQKQPCIFCTTFAHSMRFF